nr:PAS domain-containing protein [Burkholderiaceae bacterium]
GLHVERAHRIDAHARLADFVASSGDWLWETDGLRVVWVSENVERVCGVPSRMHLGHLIVERLVDDDDAAREANALALAAIRARQPFRDLRVRRDAPAGERVVVKSGVPVHDASGAFVGYRGVSSDVTEASEARRAAARAENRLREAVEALDEAFVLSDAEGRIVHTNATWRETNLEPGAPVPADWMAHLERQIAIGAIDAPPERIAEISARRLAHREACAEPFELSMRGRVYSVRDRRLSDGSIVSVGQDVTDLRAEHRAALDAIRRLQLAAGAAALRVCELDLDAGTVESGPTATAGSRCSPGSTRRWRRSSPPSARARSRACRTSGSGGSTCTATRSRCARPTGARSGWRSRWRSSRRAPAAGVGWSSSDRT